MNTLYKNIVIIIILLLFNFCDDPLPIELTSKEDEVEIDVINPEKDSYVITGYDSTGITDPIPVQKSVISLSGIKNTISGVTFYKGYGEAIFYDTSKAVYSSSNRLIGYRTLEFGQVSFDNIPAVIVPHYLKYRENFQIKDTLVGVKHVITFKKVLNPDNLDFPYDKNISIKFINEFNSPSLMKIRLPDEIVGKLTTRGSRAQNNFEIILTWNKSSINPSDFEGDFSDEIIVGGILESRDEVVPLFRLTKMRTNSFVISNSLINEVLSSGEYDYIVFTFIRKIRKSSSASRLGDVYFASQSIHNIWIKI